VEHPDHGSDLVPQSGCQAGLLHGGQRILQRLEHPERLTEVEQPTQHLEAYEVAEPAETVAPRQDEPRERAMPAEDPEAEEIVAADEEPDADDVLEATPEFLQETPEHERLWFEQKPPRDFDF